MPDPPELVERFREGGLMALVQTQEQRELMARMQPAMAVIEGYSEHVMDASRPRPSPATRSSATRWTRRRRSRSAPERLLQKLLGLNMKMRQYEQGKASATRSWPRPAIETLNSVWRSPEALPTARRARSTAAVARLGGPGARSGRLPSAA